MIYCRWILLLVVWCVMSPAAQSALEIVSIVDQPSATACLIKLFSIIATAKHKQDLSFRFVLFESPGFDAEKWNSTMATIFPDMASETKAWAPPKSFPVLSGKGFEQSAVFARFYFPEIFPNLKRFIYLDNDLIVTTDLTHLHNHQLTVAKEIPKTSDLFVVKPVANLHALGRTTLLPNRHVPRQLLPEQEAATVGFVYERHPGYKDFLRAHFNLTNPTVTAAVNVHGGDAFLNAGVFVVDVERWRLHHYTAKMESLMANNHQHTLFNAEAVGDQGPFLLLFAQDTAYLSPRYNMRRQPKKTIQLLSGGITGIVHFAGTTHADAGHLCREPLQYPMFLPSVLPLYLSVVRAFKTQRPAYLFSAFSLPTNSCAKAVPVVQAELERQKLKAIVTGPFTWPPA